MNQGGWRTHIYLLTEKYGQNIGLYRDDGLAAFNAKPQEMEMVKKGICKVFRDNDLKITIEANTTKVNFLDVTLDLRSEKYYPYTKEGNIPLYVHKESNHPPSRTSPNPLIKGYLIYHQIRNASIVLKASIKKHLTKVATAIISLSNRARHPDRGILGNEISCGSTLHTARTWQQMSENASFHSSISISLNLTPFIKFLTVTH